MRTPTQQLTADYWADFIEVMHGQPPTDAFDHSSRALLAVAFCRPDWAPHDVHVSSPQALWQVLSQDQWAGLVRWSQRRDSQAIH